MGDEQSTTQQRTSQRGSGPSMNQLEAYAGERAQVLFGCYRRADANDPDRYVAAIAAILAMYDFELIREVTDPRTGIMTNEKFMSFPPNAGELKVYCETVANRKDRLQRLGARRPAIPADRRLAAADPRDAPDGAYANVHVPATASRYAGLVKWAQSEAADRRKWRFGKSSEGVDGIWVSIDVCDQRAAPMKPIAAAAQSLTLSEHALRSMRQTDEVRNMEGAAE